LMMSVKALVFLVTVLAATTAPAASWDDPVMWLWERAWPKAQSKDQPPPVSDVVTPEALPVSPAPVPPVEVKPLPPPRPKIEAKPKETPKPMKSLPPKKSLPSCAVVKREYERMTWAQQMAAYSRATTEEIAHGKRCLGF